ncbi:hypothetical protein PI125_g18274 [Phytophthora idaei]|nr:hypothetical protein PI125_g18274 [Phytophthora idaei]
MPAATATAELNFLTSNNRLNWSWSEIEWSRREDKCVARKMNSNESGSIIRLYTQCNARSKRKSNVKWRWLRFDNTRKFIEPVCHKKNVTHCEVGTDGSTNIPEPVFRRKNVTPCVRVIDSNTKFVENVLRRKNGRPFERSIDNGMSIDAPNERKKDTNMNLK